MLIPMPDGGVAIACGRGATLRKELCTVPGCAYVGEFLCDGPHLSGRGTCDRRLCRRHAHKVGADRHYCPSHASLPAPLELEL